MILTVPQWNLRFKEWRSLLPRREEFSRFRALLEELHGFTHSAALGESPRPLPEDRLWEAPPDKLRAFREKAPFSPAWHLWHSARIEDICGSRFLLRRPELWHSGSYREKLGVPYDHTGNGLRLPEMALFNRSIDLGALREYRLRTGLRSREAFAALTRENLTRPVSPEALEEIRRRGSVAPEDEGLLAYWGKKDLRGILAMPLTRHLLVHLNSAARSMKK